MDPPALCKRLCEISVTDHEPELADVDAVGAELDGLERRGIGRGGVLSSVETAPSGRPEAIRLTVCGSAVKLSATMTGGAPGAWRIQLSTLVLSASSKVSSPSAKAGLVFLRRISALYQAKSEFGSDFSALTLIGGVCWAERAARDSRRRGEAGVRAGVPLHGRALAVAAFFFGPAGDADGILHIFFARGRRGLHADFVAVVEERGAATGKEHGRDHALDIRVVNAVAVARVEARIVVVVEDQQRNVAVEIGLGIVKLGAERGHIELVDEADLRVHGQLELGMLGGAVLLGQLGDVGQVGFADEHARAGKLVGVELVGVGAHLRHDGMHAGQIVGARCR